MVPASDTEECPSKQNDTGWNKHDPLSLSLIVGLLKSFLPRVAICECKASAASPNAPDPLRSRILAATSAGLRPLLRWSVNLILQVGSEVFHLLHALMFRHMKSCEPVPTQHDCLCSRKCG